MIDCLTIAGAAQPANLTLIQAEPFHRVVFSWEDGKLHIESDCPPTEAAQVILDALQALSNEGLKQERATCIAVIEKGFEENWVVQDVINAIRARDQHAR